MKKFNEEDDRFKEEEGFTFEALILDEDFFF